MRSRLALAALVLALPALAQMATETVTPSYSLKEQLRRADLVVFVRIKAGEADARRAVTYLAQVTDIAKGTEPKQTICFSLPVSQARLQIDSEYLVFLIRGSMPDGATVAPPGCSREMSPYQQGELFSRPQPVQLTHDIRQLCPSENCPFGDWALQVGEYEDLPEFAVSYPVQGSDRVRWIRRTQLLAALRFKLSREAE